MWQLEKQQPGAWSDLFTASTKGSILEELGREQVIADANGDDSSVMCWRCGALVASACSNVPASANAGPRAFATTAKAPDSAWPGNFGEGANADTLYRSPNGRSRDCVVPSGQKRRH